MRDRAKKKRKREEAKRDEKKICQEIQIKPLSGSFFAAAASAVTVVVLFLEA